MIKLFSIFHDFFFAQMWFIQRIQILCALVFSFKKEKWINYSFKFFAISWNTFIHLKNLNYLFYRFPFLHIVFLSLTFSYSCMERKYCSGIAFSKWRFSWIYMFWSPFNSKITFFAIVCVCVCVISITNVYIYIRNSKFGILHV